ncbi:uncharacterized protein LOC113745761 [Scomber scombrus]|uniref:Uncharacterized protein LOC113745761 n=1 Tax=Scomber scombrus TaxID=13677 RepID=A0AAV1QA55_SCOSC
MATSSTSGLPKDHGLWIFLRNRGVPEESIQKMQQDHTLTSEDDPEEGVMSTMKTQQKLDKINKQWKRSTEGADVRVPSLAPKWQEEEWKSVGRILAKGLKDHGYFPSRLAQAFTAAVIFGEHSVSPNLLFDSLMLYLSQSERDLLSTALQEAVVGDDEEELLDLMDRMGVRTVPKKDNLRAVLVQVAHKQMIQHPKYALDNISEVAGPILRKLFPGEEDMKKLYEDIKPTTRKVIKMITSSPANSAENQSLRFLHQYIRGLDEIGLSGS